MMEQSTRGSVKDLLQTLIDPKTREIMIGTYVVRIVYGKKGMYHDCDKKCAASHHEYVHHFEKQVPLYGQMDPPYRLII